MRDIMKDSAKNELAWHPNHPKYACYFPAIHVFRPSSYTGGCVEKFVLCKGFNTLYFILLNFISCYIIIHIFFLFTTFEHKRMEKKVGNRLTELQLP